MISINLKMHIRNIVTRASVIKLTLVLALFCILFSLTIYFVTAFIIVGSFRGFEIFLSSFIPAIVSPPVCILLLKVTRSLYRVKEDILKAQAELENRVAGRTQELYRANEQLKEEISERKQAEQNLQESITLQLALLENLPVGVIIVNPANRKIEFVNDFVAAMYGAQAEDIIGHKCHSLICPAAENACPVIDLHQEVDNSEREILCTDGGRRPILKSVKRIQIHGQERLLECFIDITDRKRTEEEKRKLEFQLLQSQKLESLGTLAGGIAHDFNNLLMGIQGYASLMMMELDINHAYYKQLKHIEEQVQSAADLTRQLLGFARAGKYEMRPININEIIKKTSSMFGRTRKELVIHEKYEMNLRTVEADWSQIEQVLLNLYVNAWHAMPSGGDLYLETGNVTVDHSHAAIYAVHSGNYVIFSITDTGTGMDDTTIKRIFDPFFTTKGMGRGTGLGLAMVYGIIKGHNGFIEVSSKPGQGSTFTIYIPASERKAVEEKPFAEKKILGSDTILLVDDEPIVLEVSTKLLESLGYTIHAMNSGQEAIAFYEKMKESISLIILDMIMPGLSGSQVFERITLLNPSAKIILSSGYSIDGQAQSIMDKGCHGFIQKPFSITELSRKIREVLDN
jgi:two-component system, cell cycle sensor histidine kinase and response regulator CckA